MNDAQVAVITALNGVTGSAEQSLADITRQLLVFEVHKCPATKALVQEYIDAVAPIVKRLRAEAESWAELGNAQ